MARRLAGEHPTHSLAGPLLERFECGVQSLQSTADSLCSSAEPNSEVLRLLEKLPRHHSSLKLLAQDPHKFGGKAYSEPRKHRSAEAAWLTIEVGMASQELVNQHAIRFQ